MTASHDADAPEDPLPVRGADLCGDPALHRAVRDVGERVGVDFTDDLQVRALLGRGRAVLSGGAPGGSCLGVLLLIVAAGLAVADQISPGLTEHRKALLLAAGAVAVLAGVVIARGVVLGARARRDPVFAAYREVLALARAHGLALAYVPDWLVGRTGPEGPERTPLPDLPARVRAESASAPAAGTAQAVPRKPAEVVAWEREQADGTGGGHLEGGALLLAAGAGGALWAHVSDQPLGYAALVLAVPAAVAVWVAGARRGARSSRLRAAALAYLAEVRAAQDAGEPVRELSPPLRALMSERDAS
ncbi:hypothetical protein [Streptomyces sp. SID3915]|uniref:hypothetical protein n=1 Tax=Streptomyces sp. SID3915 TaxID=2690263 RepID=UPI00136D330A|nr:hypothetical protein [Streptomyces sp. SID3915]MYX73141.1 hypothetical protein [Streptomyces sp. SID3915]